jgi:hypothetical protein
MKDIKGTLTALALLVGAIVLICICEGINVTVGNVGVLLFGLFIAIGSICLLVMVSCWADKTKEEHEKKEKIKTIDYRFSQAKYFVAILILGFFILLLVYGFLHGSFILGHDI